jgi:hypothetical protein
MKPDWRRRDGHWLLMRGKVQIGVVEHGWPKSSARYWWYDVEGPGSRGEAGRRRTLREAKAAAVKAATR